MVRKTSKDDSSGESAAGYDSEKLSGIKDSAQQIWLAGLGAFSKAQEEGGKAFDSLVKEGLSIQRKTQEAAEEKLAEATSRMASMATGISSKASGQWDKLETIFEERVGRALQKLGVPAARDVEALAARVDELARKVEQLKARSAPPRRTAAKTAARPEGKRTPTR